LKFQSRISRSTETN